MTLLTPQEIAEILEFPMKKHLTSLSILVLTTSRLDDSTEYMSQSSTHSCKKTVIFLLTTLIKTELSMV